MAGLTGEERSEFERMFGLAPSRCRDSRVTRRLIDDIADSDRGKVLFSAPFRRLQAKAQVFSLERDVAIRTRLTHSLEVSSIGRYIAQKALMGMASRSLMPATHPGDERAFITFVETACLAHDLGNPPFGHFGEHAIAEWFDKHEKELTRRFLGARTGGTLTKLWDRHYADLLHFDGNPQGFRIISRLQTSLAGDPFGLNLTHTQLASTLKYPWPCDAIPKGKKKGGYFQTEAPIVKSIREALGLGAGKRHPLVYLMEAADDIAYCLSDLEDGVEKGLVDARDFGERMVANITKWQPHPSQSADVSQDGELLGTLLALAKQEVGPGGAKVIANAIDPLAGFRSALIRIMVAHAAATFVARLDAVRDGSSGDLLGEIPGQHTSGDVRTINPLLLKWVKDFVAEKLYRSRIIKHREITAHKVVYGLLEAHRELLECPRERFEAILHHKNEDPKGYKITVESGKMSRLPRKFVQAYETAIKEEAGRPGAASRVVEWSLRAHLLVDYISGMTDDYALRSFQLLSGMRADLET
jgi:dGTPase